MISPQLKSVSIERWTLFHMTSPPNETLLFKYINVANWIQKYRKILNMSKTLETIVLQVFVTISNSFICAKMFSGKKWFSCWEENKKQGVPGE